MTWPKKIGQQHPWKKIGTHAKGLIAELLEGSPSDPFYDA
jgi:hypothetical protein